MLKLNRIPSPLKQLIAGRFISAAADYILAFAVPLLVYQTTGSVAKSGLAFAIDWLPRALALPIAGTISDRFGAQRAFSFADLSRFFLCLLGILFYPTALEYSFTFFFLCIISAISSLFYSQTLISLETLVSTKTPKRLLPTTQVLLQLVEQGSMFIAPLLAAFLLNFMETWHLIGVSSILFLFGYINNRLLSNHSFFKKVKNVNLQTNNNNKFSLWKSIVKDMYLGAKITFNNPSLILLISMAFSYNLIVGAAVSLGPAIVTTIFQQTEQEYGLLNSISGLVALGFLLLTPLMVKKFSINTVGLISFIIAYFSSTFLFLSNSFPVYALGYTILLSAIMIFNIFTRTKRALLIPSESLGKTIGFMIFCIYLSPLIAGSVVSMSANYFEPQTILLGITFVSFIITLPVYIWSGELSQATQSIRNSF